MDVSASSDEMSRGGIVGGTLAVDVSGASWGEPSAGAVSISMASPVPSMDISASSAETSRGGIVGGTLAVDV